ncbi:DUF21 domain-containing protein At2g14520-like [Durio zibethinus]|uniref:DUF21 domain-containing protein At2g14520-like n=1 Tax=Durio zibethinus TaxID=66656 RepID=A0A6P5YID0_DURZI|nr:DUF21 domain-containing protein At2g14520-like [Durio zibethinus]
MPLYDILNEFRKGHSHMAVVVKQNNKTEHTASEHLNRDVKVDIDGEKHQPGKYLSSIRTINKWKNLDGNSQRASSKSKKWARGFHTEILQINDASLPVNNGEGEATGIITLEDVIEELLQVSLINFFSNEFSSIDSQSRKYTYIYMALLFFPMQEEIFDEADHRHES